MKVTKKLNKGSIYKNYVSFALPLFLSSLLTNLYSTTDAVIAGKLINEFALGAISAAASFDTLVSSFFMGFAGGFSIYIAQLFGQGRNAKIKKDFRSVIFTVAAVAVVIRTLSVVFCDPLMNYLKVDPLLLADAKIYFTVQSASQACICVNFVLLQVLYALGVTSFALYVSIGSTVLNIVGNILFVAVFDMGVAGLAISTVAATVAVSVVYAFLIRRAFKELPDEQEPSSQKNGVVASARYTLPAALQKMLFLGVSFVIAPSINSLGAAATTGYNVTNRIYNFSSQTIWSVSSAIECHTAQCVGEGDSERIFAGLRKGFVMNTVLLVPIILAVWILAAPVSSIFFPSGYVGEAYEFAIRYIKIFLPFLILQMAGHILHGYMRSLGEVKKVLWITVVGSIVRVAATLLLVPVIRLDGVFIGQILSWAIDLLICVILFKMFFSTHTHLQKIIYNKRKI